MRDDDDVGLLEAAGTVGRIREEDAEVVARADLGDARERNDPQLVQGSPVRRIPACAR